MTAKIQRLCKKLHQEGKHSEAIAIRNERKRQHDEAKKKIDQSKIIPGI
jgi:hypothetical protein